MYRIYTIDKEEEQRELKAGIIQNTAEVEKVIAIREEMDIKQELKSRDAKRATETASGVERLQLRAMIEKLEQEVYELREQLLQSKLDEKLREEKGKLRAVYNTKVEAVGKVDCELEGKVYVEKECAIKSQEDTKLFFKEKTR